MTTLPSDPTTKHFTALDGLRGYAAMIVTFYHGILHYDPSLLDRVLYQPINAIDFQKDLLVKLMLIIFNGETAVILFYVLSGLVLHYSIMRATQRMSFRLTAISFVIRRIFRLIPAMLFCMAFFYVTSIVWNRLGLSGFPLLDFWKAMENAFLINIAVHGPSRSVQIEALATPFIVISAFLYHRYGMGALASVFCVSILALQNLSLVFFLPHIGVYLFAFILGMILATDEVAAFFLKMTTPTVLFLVFFALFVRNLVHFQSLPGLIVHTMALALVVGCIRHAPVNRVSQFLDAPFSQFLGRISYSYYLLNVVSLYVFWAIVPVTLPVSGTQALKTGLVVSVLALIATIPIAMLSERFIERPFISVGRKFLKVIIR